MKVEIWFEFASTYSYLTVSRIEPLLQTEGLSYEWKPFLLGPIFSSKGMHTSPFVLDPIKGAYMWRDIERRAKRYGLPFTRPSVFPAHSLLAARVMTAALGEPWCGAFARDVFHSQFTEGVDISRRDIVERALLRHTPDTDHWIEHASQAETKERLRATTAHAQALGIFGAPTFLVGDELFWGDDRLQDAIDWAKCIGSD